MNHLVETFWSLLLLLANKGWENGGTCLLFLYLLSIPIYPAFPIKIYAFSDHAVSGPTKQSPFLIRPHTGTAYCTVQCTTTHTVYHGMYSNLSDMPLGPVYSMRLSHVVINGDHYHLWSYQTHLLNLCS